MDHKDIEINGTRYQVSRLKARVGSFILTTMLTKMLPGAIESQLGAALGAGRTAISEADFDAIQGAALEVCRRYNAQGVPEPIFFRPDRWAIKELEYDLPVVMKLTMESLVFNLAPFFVDGGLMETILASLPPGLVPNS